MNIFATSLCHAECARVLDDKRVIKMILESTQMLSTAINLTGGTGPYKTTHPNHPCSIWVRTSITNFKWLQLHGLFLCLEYSNRYHKKHKCASILLNLPTPELPDIGLTPHPNCAANKSLGIDYKHMEDTHMAYQCYLNDRWDTDKRQPTWYGSTR
jgi:hypothetical protein